MPSHSLPRPGAAPLDLRQRSPAAYTATRPGPRRVPSRGVRRRQWPVWLWPVAMVMLGFLIGWFWQPSGGLGLLSAPQPGIYSYFRPAPLPPEPIRSELIEQALHQSYLAVEEETQSVVYRNVINLQRPRSGWQWWQARVKSVQLDLKKRYTPEVLTPLPEQQPALLIF